MQTAPLAHPHLPTEDVPYELRSPCVVGKLDATQGRLKAGGQCTACKHCEEGDGAGQAEEADEGVRCVVCIFCGKEDCECGVECAGKEEGGEQREDGWITEVRGSSLPGGG